MKSLSIYARAYKILLMLENYACDRDVMRAKGKRIYICKGEYARAHARCYVVLLFTLICKYMKKCRILTKKNKNIKEIFIRQ